MNRFFFDKADRDGDTVRLHSDEARHMLNVLRLGAGGVVILLDGSGMEHIARIIRVNKGEAYAQIYESRPNTTEPKRKITLYQGLPKGNKLEIVIQKCVELGIHEIVPMLTARCIARPDDYAKKHTRYNRIAYEAAKQSRRAVIPAVAPLTPLHGLRLEAHELVIMAYEDEGDVNLKQALRGKDVESAALIIGPEGGFEPDEASFLKGKGAVTVSLGSRILRTETAGMAALAMFQYEWEN